MTAASDLFDRCQHFPLVHPTETLCARCCVVLDAAPIYAGPTKEALLDGRAFNADIPMRTGSISPGSRDANGGKVDGDLLHTFARSHHMRLRPQEEANTSRRTSKYLTLVSLAAEKLVLPIPVVVEARDEAVKVTVMNAARGHQTRDLYCAVLLHVLRRHRIVRSHREVLKALEANSRGTHRLFLKLGKDHFRDTANNHPTCEEAVRLVAQHVDPLPPASVVVAAVTKAMDVDKRREVFPHLSLSRAIGAALLYLCWGPGPGRPTLKEMATVAKLTDVTLRTYTRTLGLASF